MGRVIKKVPYDFDWPLDRTWRGYINPYRPVPCTACGRSGLNPESRKLYDEWYGFGMGAESRAWKFNLTQEDVHALVAEDRLWEFTHTPINKEQQIELELQAESGGDPHFLPYKTGFVPSADDVNSWARRHNFHDRINMSICVEAKAKRLGIFGYCKFCNGDACYFANEQYKKLHETWIPEEPPVGPGFQLWETTSEGSPISPVFHTLDGLCRWAEENATIFGDRKLDKTQWMEVLKDGESHYKEDGVTFV